MLTPRVSEIVRTGAHSFQYEELSSNLRPVVVRPVSIVCTCGMRRPMGGVCPRGC